MRPRALTENVCLRCGLNFAFVSTVAFGETERRRPSEWLALAHIDYKSKIEQSTRMAFFSLISLSDSSGYSSVLHSKRGNQAQGLHHRNDMYVLISLLHRAFNLMFFLLKYISFAILIGQDSFLLQAFIH